MPASAQTVSVSRGKTAIEHDLREYTPNNVDPTTRRPASVRDVLSPSAPTYTLPSAFNIVEYR